MFQKHSETSKQAFKSLDNKEQVAEQIRAEIETYKEGGVTAGIIASNLQRQTGSVAARLIELERAGDIVKLSRKMENPSGKSAHVYIGKIYKPIALERGDKIIPPKVVGMARPSYSEDPEAREILKEVQNAFALGTPLIIGSPLHNKINQYLKN